MEQYTKLLFEFLPRGWFLIILPIIFIIYKIYDKSLLEAFRQLVVRKLMSNHIDISTHPLLYSKFKYINYIKNINLGDKQRNIIFKIILENMLDEILLKAKKISKYKKSELLKTDLYEGVNKITCSYEKKIKIELKKHFCKKTNDKLDSELIFELVYEKNVKEYNKRSLDFIFSIIESNENSKLNIESKIYTLFNTILAMFDTTFLNIERTFNNLNGDLTNIINKYN